MLISMVEINNTFVGLLEAESLHSSQIGVTLDRATLLRLQQRRCLLSLSACPLWRTGRLEKNLPTNSPSTRLNDPRCRVLSPVKADESVKLPLVLLSIGETACVEILQETGGMATPLNELTTGDIMEGVGTPNVDDLSDDGPLIMPPDSVEAVIRLFTAYKTMDAAGIEASTPSFSYTGPAELEEFSTFDSAMLIDRYGKSQLDYYLEEPKLPFDDKYRQFDVLAYWRQNGSKYPDVARMAKDVLSIPVSTVASESAFSAGGRVIDKYRSKLLPSNAEALICLRDWMFDIDFRAMALGNVLITDDLPMPANLVASTVPPSSFAATLMAND
ncbi:hypothetical protein NE237_005645 [Protea cynaroides]|uniref:HAT C-terminal dimerisation domain-containing protein n=1 Tax=Protea cynaroides TaxID=273540 RepID=A0A9Q0KLL6_9MAGN|nr:hypothetical protein NE237_005645 [Protea cynaroides]